MARRFPEIGEVFIPLVDGFHPITARDLQNYQEAIRAVEEALGGGANDVAGTSFGPKGANQDVAERIETFLDRDGGLRDVVFLTGSTKLGLFSENTGGVGGHFFGFPKNLSRGGEGGDSYFVLFTMKAPDSTEEGDNWTLQVPAIWGPSQRSTNGVFIVARQMDGNPIDLADSTPIQYGLLCIGYDALIVDNF